MKRRAALILALVWLVADTAAGQYYDWGQSPASVRWRSISDSSVRVVYPDYFGRKAQNTLHYLRSVRPFISHGFAKGPMKTPVVLHTQNLNSNGIVMLAPRRMELIAYPGGSDYATPWLKQLAAHEYRHAVQFNNLNTGVIKALRFILGEQGWLLGTWGLPLWMMEGDAVMAETQFTTFGRALQPSFSIEYRAMHGEGQPRYRTDKYFSGSFRDHVPDHYKLGYQLLSYAGERYGDSLVYRVSRFWARKPYLIFTTNLALRRYYDTNEKQLLNDTFDALGRHWDSIPAGGNDFSVVPTPRSSYTTYRTPVPVGDSVVYALKSDFDRYSRIVAIDPTDGSEKILAYTGPVNTPLSYAGGKLYWTELRSSTLWQERVNSVLCSYDIASGRKTSHPECGNAVYAAASKDRPIYAVYDYKGDYTIHAPFGDIALPDSVSLHSLTGDPCSDRIYVVLLGDAGMWIAQITPGGIRPVTAPTRSTLSGLRAAGGRLFYGSIASGRDEIHMLDTASWCEYRLTDSRYGSFEPTPTPDGNTIAFASYSDARNGYTIALKEIDTDSLDSFVPRYLPRNLVNPRRRQWNLFNIDTLRSEPPQNVRPAPRRYRKGMHLVNVHSWAPAYFEPERILEDFETGLSAGVTLLSQNLLSSTVARIGYGYSGRGGHMVGFSVGYYGWAPKLELSGSWGGGSRQIAAFAPPEGSRIPYPDGASKRRFDITLRAYLPLTFDDGRHIRQLVPSIELSHNNGLLLRSDMTGYHTGYRSMAASVYFSDNVRMAYRDFLPRFGYLLRASYVGNPLNRDFGDIWSASARLYLPGVASHHSLMLRGLVQSQSRGTYNFSRKELYPRGESYTMPSLEVNALSADYQLPVCYPDWGINSLLFLKRIRLNVGYDYARLQLFDRSMRTLHSVGGDIYVDFTVNRMPASATSTLRFSLYRSPGQRPVTGVGLSLPI